VVIRHYFEDLNTQVMTHCSIYLWFIKRIGLYD